MKLTWEHLPMNFILIGSLLWRSSTSLVHTIDWNSKQVETKCHRIRVTVFSKLNMHVIVLDFYYGSNSHKYCYPLEKKSAKYSTKRFCFCVPSYHKHCDQLWCQWGLELGSLIQVLMSKKCYSVIGCGIYSLTWPKVDQM